MMAEGNQPRRYPQSLQGVLQMAVDAQDQDENDRPPELNQSMNEERRQWLSEALTNLVVDEIKDMKENVDLLMDDSKDDEDKESALEKLTDMCDRIDMAKDFHKIGGYTMLPHLLAHTSPEVRWRAADFIATLVQNNPYCQSAALQAGLLELLLKCLDTDEVSMVRIKALYAISCLCREYEPGIEAFMKNDGFSSLVRAMQSDIEKLQIKACFLLQALCTSNPSCKDVLCDMGVVEQMVYLLQSEHSHVHEHLTLALLTIARDHPHAIKECQRPEFQLEELLRSKIKSIEGKPEFLEEKDYAEQLLKMCCPSKSAEVDR